MKKERERFINEPFPSLCLGGIQNEQQHAGGLYKDHEEQNKPAKS